ncbi:Translational activator GCN1 [Hordeum vulgare]|nr:Translational activator GCN1 [Hordeum vulgare]
MEQGSFSDEALMAALSYLLDNKARGVGFVAMEDTHGEKWYAVSVGRTLGVYSSWEGCNEQVSAYNNNNHTEFKTRHATEDAYAKYLRKHACKFEVGNVVVGKATPRFGVKNFIITM